MHACVILLDLMMPVMDGWEFRREQVRDARLAKIPVIVVSAAGRDRMAEIDANAYLSKPVDLDELLARSRSTAPRVATSSAGRLRRTVRRRIAAAAARLAQPLEPVGEPRRQPPVDLVDVLRNCAMPSARTRAVQ